ncbi:hypothetical protein SLEP1_g52778 [Rubroshorea leprosula]|uniref:Uncharacterized protein n=1 Tax=Rubroshorea leprosula TaxID=152421 RepID=A0AAV5M8F3_9ROSI|nr:hypothetical protein SLEP1_g52778 [Rubroshorea leprosula]
MGTDGKGGGSEGGLSPSSCLGFQRGRGGGRWTDSDSLQPPSNLQICNPSDFGADLLGIHPSRTVGFSNLADSLGYFEPRSYWVSNPAAALGSSNPTGLG